MQSNFVVTVDVVTSLHRTSPHFTSAPSGNSDSCAFSIFGCTWGSRLARLWSWGTSDSHAHMLAAVSVVHGAAPDSMDVVNMQGPPERQDARGGEQVGAAVTAAAEQRVVAQGADSAQRHARTTAVHAASGGEASTDTVRRPRCN